MAGIVALGIAIEARRNRKAAVAQQKRARTQRARDEAAAAIDPTFPNFHRMLSGRY